MGRPVNAKFFGPLADADTADRPDGDLSFNLTVNCQVGSNTESTTGYILAQRSTNKFLVNDTKDGTKRTPNGSGTGNVGVCKLVDKADGSLGVDEMSINGFLNGTGQAIRIKKLYNRTCRSFAGTRYKWTMVNDSTATVMVLTAM